MTLVEIDSPYGAPLTEEQVALIESHSVSSVKFRAVEDGRCLDYADYPIVTTDLLSAFPGWTIRRVIDNGSTRKLAEFGQRNTTVVNERCHVAVAGLGLLTIDEVEVHTDMCTNALNTKLSEGWRIVAVCVQPDQRRPDYVLGRSGPRPERESGT